MSSEHFSEPNHRPFPVRTSSYFSSFPPPPSSLPRLTSTLPPFDRFLIRSNLWFVHWRPIESGPEVIVPLTPFGPLFPPDPHTPFLQRKTLLTKTRLPSLSSSRQSQIAEFQYSLLDRPRSFSLVRYRGTFLIPSVFPSPISREAHTPPSPRLTIP